MVDYENPSVRDIFVQIESELGAEALNLARVFFKSFAQSAEKRAMDRLRDVDPFDLQMFMGGDLSLTYAFESVTRKLTEGILDVNNPLRYDVGAKRFVYQNLQGDDIILDKGDILLGYVLNLGLFSHYNLPNSYDGTTQSVARSVNVQRMEQVIILVSEEVAKSL